MSLHRLLHGLDLLRDARLVERELSVGTWRDEDLVAKRSRRIQ